MAVNVAKLPGLLAAARTASYNLCCTTGLEPLCSASFAPEGEMRRAFSSGTRVSTLCPSARSSGDLGAGCSGANS
jgi:hypothetical protein